MGPLEYIFAAYLAVLAATCVSEGMRATGERADIVEILLLSATYPIVVLYEIGRWIGERRKQ